MCPTDAPRGATRSTGRPARADEPEPLSVRAVIDSLGTGVVAALATWLVTAVPVALAWALAVPRRTSFGQMAAVSADLWALGHRATLGVDGLLLTFAPLAMTLLYAWLCHRCYRWLADGETGPARDWFGAGAWEPGLAVLGYAATGALVVGLGNQGSATIHWWSVGPGLVLVPLLAALPRALARQDRPAWCEALEDRWYQARWLAESWRPAMRAALAGLGAGALAVLALVLVRLDRVLSLHEALGPDSTGAGALTLGQLSALPNFAAWFLGWCAGAPVSIGATTVDLQETRAGTLPLLPVLGALPEGGPMPIWTWAALLVPVGLGILLGMTLPHELLTDPWHDAAATAAVGSLVCAAALAGVAWLGTGGITPGSLARIGVPALVVGGLLAVEIGIGAVATILLRRGFLGWRG